VYFILDLIRRNKKKEISLFEKLPDDNLIHILQFSGDLQTILNLNLVSKSFKVSSLLFSN
jgi:hypothetical protein